ncbi:hypothetical protein NC652_036682 [Populus alba x Populus x berolinensis]|nr:hypothetical protein NC652_036682 [Populus alba x Populus x berolinensis]
MKCTDQSSSLRPTTSQSCGRT